MDRPANVQDLFSRGSTPPADPQFQRQTYSNPPHIAPTSSLDTLLHGLSASATQQPPAALGPSFAPGPTIHQDSITPMSLLDEKSPPQSSPQTNGDRDRQHVLLSLLGSVPPGSAQNRPAPPTSSQPMIQPMTQPMTQVPSPPAAPLPAASSESQGKLLLDQIMSRYAYFIYLYFIIVLLLLLRSSPLPSPPHASLDVVAV